MLLDASETRLDNVIPQDLALAISNSLVGVGVVVAASWFFRMAERKYNRAEVGSAVMAKTVCSGVFHLEARPRGHSDH